MSSFQDAYDQWQQLAADAAATGSREARQQAEQARIALSHHPAVNRARGQNQNAVNHQVHSDRSGR